MTSVARHRLMLRAVHSGMPVVRVGRGNNAGFTPRRDRLIGGGNLTATKARLLLMACLMKFGACRRRPIPIIRPQPKRRPSALRFRLIKLCSIRIDAFHAIRGGPQASFTWPPAVRCYKRRSNPPH